MDRKLILFILSCGSLLLGLGTGLLVLHYIFKEEYSHIRPFVIIGPVLIGGGVMVIIFSFEVCIRLHQANKRVVDPDLDDLINPHEVKHWIDPRIIPYGWGLFSEAEEVLVLNNTSGGEKATLPLTSLVLRRVVQLQQQKEAKNRWMTRSAQFNLTPRVIHQQRNDMDDDLPPTKSKSLMIELCVYNLLSCALLVLSQKQLRSAFQRNPSN